MSNGTVHKNVLLFVSAYPSVFLLQFARAITQLDVCVRVICDKPFDRASSCPPLVQISDDQLLASGFCSSCVPRVCRYRDQNYDADREISGWDKALYYLTHSDLEYQFAWIAEDDVYFRSPSALKSFISETQEDASDLLCREISSPKLHPNWIHWSTGKDFFGSEHLSRGYVPFCRLSKKLLEDILLFAKTQRQLTYNEVLFTSICRSNGLVAEEFDERLRLIMYRPVRSQKEADKIFANVNDVLAIHPVKEITGIDLANSASSSTPVNRTESADAGSEEVSDIERLQGELSSTAKKVLDLENKVESQARQLKTLRSEIEAQRGPAEEFHRAGEKKFTPLSNLNVRGWLTQAGRSFAEVLSSVSPFKSFNKFLVLGFGTAFRKKELNIRLLASSELFDGKWYLERYPDVRISNIDPAQHYLQYGALEGRDPSPLFDSKWYLEVNADVRSAGINPLLHYLSHGLAEGRQPHP